MCTLVLSDFFKVADIGIYNNVPSVLEFEGSECRFVPMISSGDSIFYFRKIELITKLQGSNIMSQATSPRPSEISEKM